jgi:hypothetical protein
MVQSAFPTLITTWQALSTCSMATTSKSDILYHPTLASWPLTCTRLSITFHLPCMCPHLTPTCLTTLVTSILIQSLHLASILVIHVCLSAHVLAPSTSVVPVSAFLKPRTAPEASLQLQRWPPNFFQQPCQSTSPDNAPRAMARSERQRTLR